MRCLKIRRVGMGVVWLLSLSVVFVHVPARCCGQTSHLTTLLVPVGWQHYLPLTSESLRQCSRQCSPNYIAHYWWTIHSAELDLEKSEVQPRRGGQCRVCFIAYHRPLPPAEVVVILHVKSKVLRGEQLFKRLEP